MLCTFLTHFRWGNSQEEMIKRNNKSYLLRIISDTKTSLRKRKVTWPHGPQDEMIRKRRYEILEDDKRENKDDTKEIMQERFGRYYTIT